MYNEEKCCAIRQLTSTRELEQVTFNYATLGADILTVAMASARITLFSFSFSRCRPLGTRVKTSNQIGLVFILYFCSVTFSKHAATLVVVKVRKILESQAGWPDETFCIRRSGVPNCFIEAACVMRASFCECRVRRCPVPTKGWCLYWSVHSAHSMSPES